MTVASGPVVACGTGPLEVGTAAAVVSADGSMDTPVAEGVVVPVARSAATDPTTAVAPAPAVRASRSEVQPRRAATEVREATRQATAVAVAGAELLVGLRRTRIPAAI